LVDCPLHTLRTIRRFDFVENCFLRHPGTVPSRVTRRRGLHLESDVMKSIYRFRQLTNPLRRFLTAYYIDFAQR
jgi:hypothetical protein